MKLKMKRWYFGQNIMVIFDPKQFGLGFDAQWYDNGRFHGGLSINLLWLEIFICWFERKAAA